MGIRGNVSRSTLADANENRDWRIYADFCHILIRIARDLYKNEDFSIELDNMAYALDSTTIDLCLSLCRYQSCLSVAVFFIRFKLFFVLMPGEPNDTKRKKGLIQDGFRSFTSA